jgi:hypothetical protein
MRSTYLAALVILVVSAPSFADVTFKSEDDGRIETTLDFSAINDQFNMEVKVQKAYPPYYAITSFSIFGSSIVTRNGTYCSTIDYADDSGVDYTFNGLGRNYDAVHDALEKIAKGPLKTEVTNIPTIYSSYNRCEDVKVDGDGEIPFTVDTTRYPVGKNGGYFSGYTLAYTLETIGKIVNEDGDTVPNVSIEAAGDYYDKITATMSDGATHSCLFSNNKNGEYNLFFNDGDFKNPKKGVIYAFSDDGTTMCTTGVIKTNSVIMEGYVRQW